MGVGALAPLTRVDNRKTDPTRPTVEPVAAGRSLMRRRRSQPLCRAVLARSFCDSAGRVAPPRRPHARSRRVELRVSPVEFRTDLPSRRQRSHPTYPAALTLPRRTACADRQRPRLASACVLENAPRRRRAPATKLDPRRGSDDDLGTNGARSGADMLVLTENASLGRDHAPGSNVTPAPVEWGSALAYRAP